MDTLENRLQKRIHVSLYALLFLTVLLGISVLLEGCTDKCDVTNTYVVYEPVYTTIEEVRASVGVQGPQAIDQVGKIYYKDGFMFVNEPGTGIHIIDNRDPSNPKARHFLKIPGNFDLAIKNNTLYADSFVDLIAFDISNMASIHEAGRLEGIFKNYTVMGFRADPNCCVITSWSESETIHVAESDCRFTGNNGGGFMPWGSGIALEGDMALSFSSKAAIAPGTGSGTGLGGSLARFTISDDHLYMLDGADLQTVDITTEQHPKAGNRSYLAWDIETIFPYKENLFIGSSSGMRIMSITDPTNPSLVSTYEHVRSCDPVVVDDNYAYVTLRSGTTCQGFTNQLEVIDISNLSSPTLLKTYPMTNPHGLGIDNNTLFICDGAAGLKAYDASDVNAISSNLLAHYENINATDVIPFNNLLMMIGEDGIFQYDYADPANIKLLSKIDINNAN